MLAVWIFAGGGLLWVGTLFAASILEEWAFSLPGTSVRSGEPEDDSS